jgi:hypothetical protein
MVAGLVMEFSAYHASKPQIPTESGIFIASPCAVNEVYTFQQLEGQAL